jgi:multiple sugar transport system substrate-binding protein
MKQKKWFVVVGVFLAISIIVASIQYIRSMSNEINGGGQPASESPKEIITFSYTSFGSDAEMRRVIDTYNQTNSDHVFVQLLTVPRENYTRTLNMLMTSGEGPDLFSIQSDWVTTYMYKNWLKDISEDLPETMKQDYSDWAFDYGSFNGKQYVIPYGLSTVRLGYNKELFRLAGLDENRPPQTLAELKEMATMISKKQIGNQKYGFVWPLAEEWYGFMQSMEIPLTYSGVSVFNFKGGKFDTTGYAPWMETMLEMKNNGSLFPGNLTMKYDTALTQFAKGNVGMMLLSSSDVYRLENELNIQTDWGVGMPPALDQQKIGAGALMIVPEPVIGINSATSHSEASTRFWQYLHSDSVITRMYQKGIYVPVSSRIRQANAMDATQIKSKFMNFQPTTLESFYPKPPVLLDSSITTSVINQDHFGWNNRLKAYREIASGTAPVQDMLKAETQRMNAMLQGAIQMGSISIQSYIQASFDMKHPLKK